MTVVTKSKTLPCSVAAAWALLADGSQWPRWATRNVLASKPSGPGCWEIQTPRGSGTLRIRGDAVHGILDHDFIDLEGTWTVPCRVVPTSAGCVFILTLEKPTGMADAVFERGLEELDYELAQLARLASTL